MSNQATLVHPNISVTPNIRINKTVGVKLYIYSVSLAAFLVVIGILWDISWHSSIGRDQFFTPPHILIYVAAILGGLVSGIQVLINSYKPSAERKNSLVKVWGVFYASLGSLFCIWGAIAMLTSAPFDDWWHSAYGLDVKIFSPPHALLVLGILCLEFGGCICINKYINQANAGDRSLLTLQILFIITASCLLSLLFTIANPIIKTRYMREALFYQAATAMILLILPAFSRSLRMKWGMTSIAIGYFLVTGLINWTLQIFPAEPKLGPVLTHTTHFQPAMFPMLIVVPAIFMDLLIAKFKGSEWMKSFLLSVTFVLLFVLVQYPFSGFLLQSPNARNWFFGAESWYFWYPANSPYRYKFNPNDVDSLKSFAIGTFIAIIIGTLVSRISLSWGKWMLRIQR